MRERNAHPESRITDQNELNKLDAVDRRATADERVPDDRFELADEEIHEPTGPVRRL